MGKINLDVGRCNIGWFDGLKMIVILLELANLGEERRQ